MDPVKEPMCAVCGATQAVAALVGRPEAGWVCADSVPCIERSNHRAWVPARPWELGTLDICEKGQHSFSWRMGLEPCRYCGLPSGSELPDYEALGYTETEVTDYISTGGLDALPETLDLLIGSVLGDITERIQKRYP